MAFLNPHRSFGYTTTISAWMTLLLFKATNPPPQTGKGCVVGRSVLALSGIRDTALAGRYAANWRVHAEHSVPYPREK